MAFVVKRDARVLRRVPVRRLPVLRGRLLPRVRGVLPGRVLRCAGGAREHVVVLLGRVM